MKIITLILITFVTSLFALELEIKKNWQIVGTDQNISINTFDESCVDYIWQYDNSDINNPKWKVRITKNQTINHSFDEIESFKPNQGFWIKGNSNCQISITSNSTNTSNKIVHSGYTYDTVISPYTGRVWLDRNLGASQVCTSIDDEKCFGNYYQWGRSTDGHEKNNSENTDIISDTINTNHNKFILSDGDNGYDWTKEDLNGTKRIENWSKLDGSSICPIGFRIPTIEEINLEIADFNNSNDALNSFLKIPSAGYKYTDTGEIKEKALKSHFWSSSQNKLKPYYLRIGIDFISTYYFYSRATGNSIRCIKDESQTVISNNKPTATYASLITNKDNSFSGTLTGADDDQDNLTYLKVTDPNHGTLLIDINGSFTYSPDNNYYGEDSFSYKVNDGIIDSDIQIVNITIKDINSTAISEKIVHNNIEYGIVVSPYTGRIWLDRNLGASEICNKLPKEFIEDENNVNSNVYKKYIADQKNCFGDYFQWGRDADGHEKIDSETTDIVSNTLNTDHNKFITVPDYLDDQYIEEGDWLNADSNYSLRAANWLKLDGTGICPVGFRVPTENEIYAETIDQGNINYDDVLNSFLNLPVSSYKQNSDGIINGYDFSSIWSLTNLISFGFEDDIARKSYSNPARGLPVRCIMDNTTKLKTSHFIVDAGENKTIHLGESINFTANILSNDNNSEVSYNWNDELNNTLSTEPTFDKADFTVGRHTITLNATNGNGKKTNDKVIVTVNADKTITHKGYEYGTIISPTTGRIWLDRNLGASEACNKSALSFIENEAYINQTVSDKYIADQKDCFGDYYQWGRNTDGHEKLNSEVTDIISDSITPDHNKIIIPDTTWGSTFDWAGDDTNGTKRKDFWSKIDGTSICPSGFRVPTKEEFQNENIQSGSEANELLKIPSAGVRDYDGIYVNTSNHNYLWTVDSYYDKINQNVNAILFYVPANTNYYYTDSTDSGSIRASLFPVRCIKNTTGVVANAGEDQNISYGDLVTLNGEKSLSLDGEIVSYEWKEGSNILSKESTFTTSELSIGTHTITLKVTDNNGKYAIDTIIVNIIDKKISHNGFTYKTVTSPYTGKVWLDRNLGANKNCTSIDDSECFGDYYQFGRSSDGHQLKDSNTTNILATTISPNHGSFIIREHYDDWTSDDSNKTQRKINWLKNDGSSICPIGFRVPLKEEISAELTFFEDLSAESAHNSFFKFPISGLRDAYDGILYSGYTTYIWYIDNNSTFNSASLHGGDYVLFSGIEKTMNEPYGLPVRCIKSTDK